jgi:hypothetical protein
VIRRQRSEHDPHFPIPLAAFVCEGCAPFQPARKHTRAPLNIHSVLGHAKSDGASFASLLVSQWHVALSTGPRLAAKDSARRTYQRSSNTDRHGPSTLGNYKEGGLPSGLLHQPFVGMVKLTAICGIGSALWKWSKRNDKGKAVPSPEDSEHAEAVGKNAPDDLQPVEMSTGSREPTGPDEVF